MTAACARSGGCPEQGGGMTLKVLCARSMTAAVNALARDFTRATGQGRARYHLRHGRCVAGETRGRRKRRHPRSRRARDREDGAGGRGPGWELPRHRAHVDRCGGARGAAAPDVSTADAFKQALLAARAVAFSDPAVGGSAGVHLAQLWGRMGMADEIARKGMPQKTGGEVAARVAEGEAEIGLTLVAEIVPITGARVIGKLPAPFGKHDLRRRHFGDLHRSGGGRSLHRGRSPARRARRAGPQRASTGRLERRGSAVARAAAALPGSRRGRGRKTWCPASPATATDLPPACAGRHIGSGRAARRVPAHAAYPERVITLIVPFAAGGPTDIIARIVAVAFQEVAGPVGDRREPRVAGAAIPAWPSRRRAAPDGYTLLLTSTAIAVHPGALQQSALTIR